QRHAKVGAGQHQRGGQAQAQGVDRRITDTEQRAEAQQLHQRRVVLPQTVEGQFAITGCAHGLSPVCSGCGSVICMSSRVAAPPAREWLVASSGWLNSGSACSGTTGWVLAPSSSSLCASKYCRARCTAPTTARGVMVAPANWSKSPRSFFTAQPDEAGSVSERFSKLRIH